MALTESQTTVLRLLTEKRRSATGSYIAGGAALNQVLGTGRRSNDRYLFHDTTEALQNTWDDDKKTLLDNGFAVEVEREAPSFIDADIVRGSEHVLIQWARDSAFRFFPLVEDKVLGLTLHPLDLATNKILALAGRLEPRDWIDTIECHRHIQPLGYLMWAACGKDPGINPQVLLADAGRFHYSQQEIDPLDFEGETPSAALLSTGWKEALMTAAELIAGLPDEHLGECILDSDRALYKGSAEQFGRDFVAGNLRFHKGSIHGAWPQIVRTEIP